MRIALSTFVLLLVVTSVASAAGQVTLSASNMPIKDAVAQIEQQSGVTIVLDPKVQANITLNLSDAEVNQALDVITKLNKLTWKKLQFAKQKDSSVKLDQLKSAILAMSTLPMVGLTVEDPASKTTAMYAKDLPASPDTSSLRLPEGYAWTTVYVILNPEAEMAADGSKSDVAELSKAEAKNTIDMANMTPADRQQIYASEMSAMMTLTPEARQALIADRMRAMFNMDPQYNEQFRQDMRQVMQSLHASGEMPNWGGRGGRNRNR